MYDLSKELTVILIIIWLFGEVRERLSVSKQAVQKFDVERFSFKKLSELECGHAVEQR
jgi:hypothetical protein